MTQARKSRTAFLQYAAWLHSPAWWEGLPSGGENVGPAREAHA